MSLIISSIWPSPGRSQGACDFDDTLGEFVDLLLQRVAGDELAANFLDRDGEIDDFVIITARADLCGVDSDIFKRPFRDRLARGHHYVARLRNPRDVEFIVGDGDDQRRLRGQLLPAVFGLAFDDQPIVAGFDVIDERYAWRAQFFRQQPAGLRYPPIARFASQHHQVERADLADRGGERLGHGQRIGMRMAVVDHERGGVRLHRQSFSQRVFSLFGAERQRGDLASRFFTQLQRGLQRVLAENVRDQIGGAADGLLLFAFNAEIARGNLRVENLFNTNYYVHDNAFGVQESASL